MVAAARNKGNSQVIAMVTKPCERRRQRFWDCDIINGK